MRDNRHDCSPALQTKDCRLEPLDVVSVHSSKCECLWPFVTGRPARNRRRINNLEIIRDPDACWSDGATKSLWQQPKWQLLRVDVQSGSLDWVEPQHGCWNWPTLIKVGKTRVMPSDSSSQWRDVTWRDVRWRGTIGINFNIFYNFIFQMMVRAVGGWKYHGRVLRYWWCQVLISAGIEQQQEFCPVSDRSGLETDCIR